MKTIYTLALLLFTAVSALGQNGQIVNGGFENWEDIQLFESPNTWKSSDEFSYYGVPTTSKSTDAQDGIYSARLDVVEVEGNPVTGFVYHGDMDNFGPTGGIPYTDNFEAISVHYKTDLNVGDSLFMLLIRYNAGVMVEVQSIPFAIGSNAAWTPTVIYTGNAVQDELFIGFLLGDPFGANTPTVGSWAMVDNVKFLSGGIETSLIPNHSFEDWTSHTFESPEDWYTINDLLAGYGLENATKTTDAFSGNYAIEMTTIDAFTDTIFSILSMGAINFASATPFANVAYNAEPTSFVGRYKYAPNNGDVAEIYIEFYEAGTSIGFIYEPLNPAPNYTSIVSPISLSGVPDSIAFYVHSGSNPGSILKLDDLSFQGGTIGIANIISTDFEIYPNPASNEVFIGLPEGAIYTIEILNLEGKLITIIPEVMGINPIDITTFEHGVYMVHISNENSSTIRKLVVN